MDRDGGPRFQPVETETDGDSGQPGREVRDRLARPVQPQPGLLGDILGLGRVAQHSCRERDEPRAFGGEGCSGVHWGLPVVRVRPQDDDRGQPNVTIHLVRAPREPSRSCQSSTLGP